LIDSVRHSSEQTLTIEVAPLSLAQFPHDPVLGGAWRDWRYGGVRAWQLAAEEDDLQ
jgi:hypothetical protein